MKKRIKLILALLIFFVAIQLIPVKRDNPVTLPGAEIDTDLEIMTILEVSCFDCHSNNTQWPWYSYVAPVSWWVTHDVNDGRKELNFSNWNTLKISKQRELRTEIWKQVKEGEMPHFGYIPLHPRAEVTAKEKIYLKKWTEIAN